MLAYPPPAADRSLSIANAIPMQASMYLRLRREAVGLSKQQVARQLHAIRVPRKFGDRRERRLYETVAEALSVVEQLELPNARAKYPPIIDLLTGIFPLDPDVYRQLASEPADRHPATCRSCACSNGDPCFGGDGICTLEHAVCTRCLGANRKLAA